MDSFIVSIILTLPFPLKCVKKKNPLVEFIERSIVHAYTSNGTILRKKILIIIDNFAADLKHFNFQVILMQIFVL